MLIVLVHSAIVIVIIGILRCAEWEEGEELLCFKNQSEKMVPDGGDGGVGGGCCDRHRKYSTTM